MSINATDLAGPAPAAPPTKALETPQSAVTAAASERLTVIEPGRAERNYWRDLWQYRELFAILAWRDVSVRYKQTVIGVAWALIRPFLTMVVFTIVFGQLAKLPSEGEAPYPIMVFAGLMPWFLFAERAGRRLEQPHRQCAPDLESLFSTPRHSNCRGAWWHWSTSPSTSSCWR